MNNFVRAFINRSRTVLTAMVVLALAGVLAFLSLPREADPDIDIPLFYISIAYPGISPEDSERLLVQPMEVELRSLEGLDEMVATASQNHAGIRLEFEVDFDKDVVLADIRNKVDLAKAQLPSGAEEPEILEFNTSLFPVIVVTLAGDVPERTLYRHARQLQDLLETIPSVLEAKLAGHREELLEIIADPAKVEAYNIQYEQLINTVSRNNLMIAAGNLDTGRGQFAVKLPGLIESAEDLFNIPLIGNEKGGIVLSDVADIRRTFKDPDQIVRFNGKPAITIEVVKRLGSNIVETTETVRAYVSAAQKNIPPNIEIGFNLDASTWIHRSISSLSNSIFTAILLVMIVVVSTLGLRSGSLVGIAIPISFMITFFLLGLGGLTINMMVMFGLVLSVGILVDGAIVIVEYADRKMAEGLHKKEAFIMASQRMFFPIISSTATTLAAFIPLMLWPGVSGQFMSYLPMTLILVLSAALVTALIFLPVIGSLLGKTNANDEQRAQFNQIAGDSSDKSLQLSGLTGLYVKMLKSLLTKPITVVAGTLLVGFMITTIFGRYNHGVEFFVQTEPESAVIYIGARGNLSLEDKYRLTLGVEEAVMDTQGVDTTLSFVGFSSGGQPRLQDAPLDLISYLLIELKPFQERRKGEIILEEIRQKAKNFAGINIEIRKQEEGPPVGKDIQIEVKGGLNRAHLFEATGRITDHLKNEQTLLDSIEDSRPLPGIEWVLDIDREIASRYQSDVALLGAAIQLVTDGILVGEYRPDDSDDEVEIRLRFPKYGRALDQLDALRLPSIDGPVPARNFVERRAQKKVDNIERVDGQRRTLVRASTIIDPETGKKVLANDKIAEIDTWLQTQNFGTNLFWQFRGSNEEQEESAQFLGKAMLAALFLMFLILITQFNSFYQAILTLSTVVISIFGVMIGMLATAQTFSVIMTGTGIMALAGIVVNNSIVLIDTYNRLRQEITDKLDAVLRTAAQRLRPILLTTITTMIGLLPMALQIQIDFFNRQIDFGSVVSVWWVQLATTIIFGLGFATFITLIFTPVMLVAPEVLKRRFVKISSWFKKPAQSSASPSL